MNIWKTLKTMLDCTQSKEKKKSTNVFPVLRLPSVVLDIFLKQLGPSERFKFGFISKRTYHLCQQKWVIPKDPYQILGFSYPPMLSLSFEPDRYISFNFQHMTIWKEKGKNLKPNFAGNSICVKHYHPRTDEKIMEEYTIYCDDLVREQMKWAKYFCTIFNFSGNFIAIQFLDEGVGEFVDQYKSEIDSSIFQLVVGKKEDEECLDGEKLKKLVDSVVVTNFLWIRPPIADDYDHAVSYELTRFTSEKSQGITVDKILNINSYFIDLRNSTMTDAQVNELVHAWRDSGNMTLKCLSLKRNFSEQYVDYDALCEGLVDENETPDVVRTLNWVDGMGNPTTWTSPGGFDITRADGRRLTVFVMTIIEEVNCHVFGFHVWN